MPPQEEHERPEDMVEAPGEAEKTARSLEDAVDSHGTLDGFYAMNNLRPGEEQTSPGAEEDKKQAEQQKT